MRSKDLTAGISAAERLLAYPDAAYWRFVDRQPASLARLASLASTFDGQPGGERFAGISGINPLIGATPLLFKEALLADDEWSPACDLAAEGGAFLVLAYVVLDHILDGQSDAPGLASLLHQALLEHGVRRLHEALPADNPFWRHYDRLMAAHRAGLAREAAALADPGALDEDAFEALATAKILPSLVTLAALTELLDRRNILPMLEQSLTRAILSGQLHDDVGDWRDDLAARHFTFFLSRQGEPAEWQAPVWPSPEAIEVRLTQTWDDVNQVNRALAWLDEARDATADLGCEAWHAYLLAGRAKLDRHLTQLTAARLRDALAPLLPGASDSDHELADPV